MEKPLEIAFHNMAGPPWLEAEIRRHIEQLEKKHNNITRFRVSVETPHLHHRHGNTQEVHINISIPGQDVAVSYETHHARERYASPDALITIRDAFKAANRKLERHKSHRRNRVMVG